MLTIEELSDLEEQILSRFPEQITSVLVKCNRENTLSDLLNLLGMDDLVTQRKGVESYKEGKIVVIGGSNIKENILLSIAKSLGLEKSRFEFCLEYDDAQKFDYRKMQYAPSYRLIMFGPVPHSGKEKRNSGSIIAEVEKHPEMYPRVERLMAGDELKITKTNFRNKLTELQNEGYI